MTVVLLEAPRRPDPRRELDAEMKRVWATMDRMDDASARRVLDAVADMRRDVLDRLAALPTVTIDDAETFQATALRAFAADLQDALGRFEQRYSLLLGTDMRAVAAFSDEAHRAALSQLARSLGVPRALISMAPLGLSDDQIEAAVLLHQTAIRNVSQAVVGAVNAEIQRAVFGGGSRWDAVRNIRAALATTGKDLGALTQRALTIERTALIQAFNVAAEHAYRQSREELPELQVEWMTAKDKRVDPICTGLSGARREPGGRFPGGYSVPPAHPRCLVGGTFVAAPRVLASTTRWYTGEVVEIRTAAGHILTVTPNHPILTLSGWVAAGLVYEGLDVVSSADPQRLAAAVSPDEHHGPTVIEEVARSFHNHGAMLSMSMPTAAEDFHGDGVGSQVCVIRTDRELWDRLDASIQEPLPEHVFEGGRMESEALAGLSRAASRLDAIRSAALRGVSSLDGSHASFRRSDGLLQSVGLSYRAALNAGAVKEGGYGLTRNGVALAEALFRLSSEVQRDHLVRGFGLPTGASWGKALLIGSAPNGDPETLKCSPNGIPSNVVRAPESRHRQAGLVTRDEVVGVRRIPGWSGHVYNLETSLGWYIANGIVTHNCRCRIVASMPGWSQR